MPHSIRKIPSVTKVNGSSLKTVGSGAMLRKLTDFRGRRLRTSKFAMMSRKTRIKPMIRVAHANQPWE